MTIPYPVNESERIAALRALDILDTPPEAHIDAVTRVAQATFGAPIVLVTLLDEERQWFKSRCGTDIEGTPREIAFCNYTILGDEVFVVEDAVRDERFARNPLVTGPLGIRFYAGAPLVLHPGLRLGTFCVLDTKPRAFSESERRTLQDFVAIVVAHLRLHEAGIRLTRQSQDLHKREVELSEQNRLLAFAEQLARVGTWRVDLPEMRLHWSPEVFRIYGLDPNGAKPDMETAFNAYHPDDRDGVRRFVAEAIATGRPCEQQWRLIRSDGEVRHVLVRGVSERNPDGLASALVGVFIDLTDYRRREAELDVKTKLLGATLDTMDQGLIMADAEGVLQVCNRHAVDLLGLPERFASDKPSIAEVVAHQRAAGEFAGLAIGDAPWLVPRNDLGSAPPLYERTRPNGTTLEVRTTPLAGGGFVRTYTDVTTRKDADKALHLRDRSLAAIGQGVVITDATKPDVPIIYVNPAFERLSGYPADEAIGRNCRFLQGAETDREAVARLGHAIAAGQPIRETLVNYRRDGTAWLNELTIAPVRDASGRITHSVGTQSDVTERHNLETKLRQSQKMEALGQLTGGVAHDFNNLLTVILGNTEIIAEEAADPLLRDLADQILSAGIRGSDLTQKLLAFGRRQSLNPERLDLCEVVRGMAPLLRRTIGEHIELVTRSDGPAPAVADRILLENAILNLALNARDAMPGGGVLTITTGSRTTRPGEGSLPIGETVAFVAVGDTGTGMPTEIQQRAFEPFFTTKEVGRGTGLGLAMVYGFAQQSGGHAAIRSESGQGTTVTILLRAASHARPAKPAMEERVHPLAADGGGMRVLVVEDDPQVLTFVRGQILGLGYDVTAAPSGPDALALLDEGRSFDLLFTDVVLPKGMSGVELARQAVARDPALRVLLTSGYPETAFEHQGRPEGMDLLPKPYLRRQLAEALRQALGEDRQQAPGSLLASHRGS